MSTDTSRPTVAPAEAVRRRRAVAIALWVAQLALAVQFAGGGLLKLIGDPAMTGLFDTIGAGQWLRVVVGLLEVAGAIGLLVPRLCGLAAAGLSLLMVGATITNLVVLQVSAALPLILLVVGGAIAYGRRERTRALVGRPA